VVCAEYSRTRKPCRRPVQCGFWDCHRPPTRVRSPLGRLRQALCNAPHGSIYRQGHRGWIRLSWGRRSTIFPRLRPACQKAAERCGGDDFRGSPARWKLRAGLCPVSWQHGQQLPLELLAGRKWIRRRRCLYTHSARFCGKDGQQCICRVLARCPQGNFSSEAVNVGRTLLSAVFDFDLDLIVATPGPISKGPSSPAPKTAARESAPAPAAKA
jgi:hypothetical protein